MHGGAADRAQSGFLEDLHLTGMWQGAGTAHAWPHHMGDPKGKNQTEGTNQERS